MQSAARAVAVDTDIREGAAAWDAEGFDEAGLWQISQDVAQSGVHFSASSSRSVQTAMNFSSKVSEIAMAGDESSEFASQDADDEDGPQERLSSFVAVPAEKPFSSRKTAQPLEVAPADDVFRRTQMLMQQLALQSSVVAAEARSLEHASLNALGRPARPDLAPQLHVSGFAGRGLDEPAQSLSLFAAASMGVAGLALMLGYLFLVASRDALAMSALRRKGRASQMRQCQNKCQAAQAQTQQLQDGQMPQVHAKRQMQGGFHGECGVKKEVAGLLSTWDGTVSAFSCLVGTGLLAMPYAFALAGMVAVPIIFFVVLCSAYTAHLLAWSLNELGQFSLGHLVEAAFGRRARRATEAFLIFELWGYLLSSLLCGSLNAAQLMEGIGFEGRWAFLVSFITVYAVSFLPSRVMTRVNVLSNVSLVACCCMYLLTGLCLPTKRPASDVYALRPQGLLPAAGILIFSPAGHSFFPALMGRMKEPACFSQSLRRAYTAAGCLYLIVAVSGYNLFGNASQPSLVRNIGSDLSMRPLPDLGWMGPLAALGMCVKMLALAALALTPLVATLQQSLSTKVPGSFSQVREEPVDTTSALTLIVLAVSSVVAAQFAHEMATLLNLMGSVLCTFVAFVLPVLCYWRLAKEPIGSWSRFFFIALIAMGVSFALLGPLSMA